MDVEMASCLLTELRDPKKATYYHPSSGEGKFSWEYTKQEEHQARIVIMASNIPSEITFEQLTRLLQSFGRVLGTNAAAVAHAIHNGDIRRSSGDCE